jgi:uncharacterized protein (UPF0303 family)
MGLPKLIGGSQTALFGVPALTGATIENQGYQNQKLRKNNMQYGRRSYRMGLAAKCIK